MSITLSRSVTLFLLYYHRGFQEDIINTEKGENLKCFLKTPQNWFEKLPHSPQKSPKNL